METKKLQLLKGPVKKNSAYSVEYFYRICRDISFSKPGVSKL